MVRGSRAGRGLRSASNSRRYHRRTGRGLRSASHSVQPFPTAKPGAAGMHGRSTRADSHPNVHVRWPPYGMSTPVQQIARAVDHPLPRPTYRSWLVATAAVPVFFRRRTLLQVHLLVRLRRHGAPRAHHSVEYPHRVPRVFPRGSRRRPVPRSSKPPRRTVIAHRPSQRSGGVQGRPVSPHWGLDFGPTESPVDSPHNSRLQTSSLDSYSTFPLQRFQDTIDRTTVVPSKPVEDCSSDCLETGACDTYIPSRRPRR